MHPTRALTPLTHSSPRQYLCTTSTHAIRQQLGKKVDERYTGVQRSRHLAQAVPHIFGQSILPLIKFRTVILRKSVEYNCWPTVVRGSNLMMRIAMMAPPLNHGSTMAVEPVDRGNILDETTVEAGTLARVFEFFVRTETIVRLVAMGGKSSGN